LHSPQLYKPITIFSNVWKTTKITHRFSFWINYTKYIQEIRERIVQAYKVASEASIKAQTKQKEGYDLRTRGAIIEPGDRVLAFDNKHKISNRWENDTYIVLKKPNLDIPVFTVQTENGQGRIRTLHRNLLLPVAYISHTPDEEQPKPIPKPRTRFQKKQRKHTPMSSDESSSSSSEEDYTLVRQGSTLPYNVVDANNVQGHEELNIPESDGAAQSISDNKSDSESNRMRWRELLKQFLSLRKKRNKWKHCHNLDL
jgi:hypothetical protein